MRAAGHVNARRTEYLGYLIKGQLPPARLSLVTFSEMLVIDGFKYTVSVTRSSPTTFNVELGGSLGKSSPSVKAQQQGVDVIMRHMAGGGFLMQVSFACVDMMIPSKGSVVAWTPPTLRASADAL